MAGAVNDRVPGAHFGTLLVEYLHNRGITRAQRAHTSVARGERKSSIDGNPSWSRCTHSDHLPLRRFHDPQLSVYTETYTHVIHRGEDERGNRWVHAEFALAHFNEFPFRVPSEQISCTFPA